MAKIYHSNHQTTANYQLEGAIQVLDTQSAISVREVSGTAEL